MAVERHCQTSSKGKESASDGPRARPGPLLCAERRLSRAQTEGIDRNRARVGTAQQRLNGAAGRCALTDECQPREEPTIHEPDQRFAVPAAVDRPDLQCHGHLAPTGRPQPSPPPTVPFLRAYEGSRQQKMRLPLCFLLICFFPPPLLYFYSSDEGKRNAVISRAHELELTISVTQLCVADP